MSIFIKIGEPTNCYYNIFLLLENEFGYILRLNIDLMVDRNLHIFHL